MSLRRHPGSLLQESDLSRAEFLGVVEDARALKAARRGGTGTPVVGGRTIALVFQKASIRPRCAGDMSSPGGERGRPTTTLMSSRSHWNGRTSRPGLRLPAHHGDGLVPAGRPCSADAARRSDLTALSEACADHVVSLMRLG